MAPNAHDDDEISLIDLLEANSGENDFIFDLNDRWQSAYLDSVSTMNFNESASSISFTPTTAADHLNKSCSSIVSFSKDSITTATLKKNDAPSSSCCNRRSKFARGLAASRSASSRDSGARRRPKRREPRAQRLSSSSTSSGGVPTTVSLVESKP